MVAAMRVYELWEAESGNLMAAFDTRAEALAAVARTAEQYGPQSVESMSLVTSDDTDEDVDIVTIGDGLELLALANAAEASAKKAAIIETVHEASLTAPPTTRGVMQAHLPWDESLKRPRFSDPVADLLPKVQFPPIPYYAMSPIHDPVFQNMLGLAAGLTMSDAVRQSLGTFRQHILELTQSLSVHHFVATDLTPVRGLAETIGALQSTLRQDDLLKLSSSISEYLLSSSTLPSFYQEKVDWLARSFIDARARDLLKMPGDEFISRAETGELEIEDEPTKKAEVGLMLVMTSLVRRAA